MDLLFTSDPANFHYISTTNFHNYPKGREFREIFAILGDGIFNSDSELWELHRKTTMSLFNHPDFLNLVEENTRNIIEEKLLPVLEVMLERGSKMDLQEIFQRLTFDSMLNLVLQYDPKTLSVDFPHDKFEVSFSKSEEALQLRHTLPECCWKLLEQLEIGNEKHLSVASMLSDKVLYKLINDKREKQARGYDIYEDQVKDLRLLTGFMREYKNHPNKFIKDTLLNVVVAGRNTTSSALTWFFYLLSQNPLIRGKIRNEIRTQLGVEEGEKCIIFGIKQLEKLDYLHGALSEALRLFPPVPINLKTPLEVDTLPSGHRVHKNTKIYLHSYAMARMEKIWGQDCLEFKLERWFMEKGGIKHVPSHKFPAFHTGPRSCIGKKFSLIQMKMVAATIIYNYNVQMVDGHPITQKASLALQMKNGLMVKLEKNK